MPSLRLHARLTYSASCPAILCAQHWDDMERVWGHLLHERMGFTDADLGGKRVLVTEAPMNPRENR